MSGHSTDATYGQSEDIDNHAINRSQSNEEAPFTMSDLQSELSDTPGPSHMQQTNPSQDNNLLEASSGISTEAPNPSAQGTSHSEAPSKAAAAAVRPHAAHDPGQPIEKGNGHDFGTDPAAAANQYQAEHSQKPSVNMHQSHSADSSTGNEDRPPASPHAISTAPAESSLGEQQSKFQHAVPADTDFPSTAAAVPGNGSEEAAAQLGVNNPPSGTSRSFLVDQQLQAEEDRSADTALLQPQLTAAAAGTDVLAAQSVFHSGTASGADQSLELPPHTSQQHEDSNRAQHAFPDDTPDAEASAPQNSIAAGPNLISGRSSSQRQELLQSDAETDEDNGDMQQLRSGKIDAASTPGDSSFSQDKSGLQTEVRAADSDWAANAFAQDSAPVQADAQTDRSTSRQAHLAMPQQADDADWADDTFGAAPPAVEAEQSASLPPSAEADAAANAAALNQDESSASVQEQADSDDWPSEAFPAEPLPAQPAADSPSLAAAREADTAADNSSAPGHLAAPHGQQQADEEDWGDDDFGDFNDAANEADDDDGFGAFNEADAMAGQVNEVAQSPEARPQKPQTPAAPSGKLIAPNHPGMCKTSSSEKQVGNSAEHSIYTFDALSPSAVNMLSRTN